MTSDKKVDVYQFLSGKIIISTDLGYSALEKLQMKAPEPQGIDFRLHGPDFDKKMVHERDMTKLPGHLTNMNAIFDEQERFIIFPTLFGICYQKLESGKIVKLLGNEERNERFIHLSLFQGKPQRDTSGQSGKGGSSSQVKELDPCLFCTSFKRRRFYIFSKRAPPETSSRGLSRDVFNEKPSKEELLTVAPSKVGSLGTKVVMCTTMGDIFIRLFPQECPRTVENFLTHAKNGYYNSVIFHRVIKGFMIQTGDPQGDGTGGESIWGGKFEDEIHPSMNHEKPFTVSMANRGSNTNGSQFFITTVPTPWLDKKHTVFGKVYKGTEVVLDIENVKCDDYDKPLLDIKILVINLI